MRMEVVNRIESVIKELWPSADVSTCWAPGPVLIHMEGLPLGGLPCRCGYFCLKSQFI